MPQTRYTVSRRKKDRSNTRFLRESPIDSLDFDFEGEGEPFYDDELLTLDEFESLHSPPRGAEKEKTATCRQRIDPPVQAIAPRQKVPRRRQIDPTTCEREYTIEEVEFMNALSEYKRNSGRMFPTCSEILEVLKGLGYEKVAQTAALENDESEENETIGLTMTPKPGEWARY